MTYIHELAGWPQFQWNDERLLARLAEVRHRQGRLIGRMEALGFELRAEASLQSLTEEVVKSSEIEGERLDRDQVRSSIARRLGISSRTVRKHVQDLFEHTGAHTRTQVALRWRHGGRTGARLVGSCRGLG